VIAVAAVTTRVGGGGARPIRKEAWMLSRFVMFAVAAAFIWPGAVVAQEGEDAPPPMLMISSWKCDFGNMGAIGEDWDTRSVNAARHAVDNSSWISAGVFYHSWADEWNVNFWALGEDIPALLEGQEASNTEYDEMYPEGLDLWDNCSEHKDGFYQFGKAIDDGSNDVSNQAMAVSSWKCTDVGAVNDAWESSYHASAQAVVDAGQWTGAGVFYHAWAGEWNVNFYYIGEDIPSILEGWEAYVDSFGDDAPNLTDYCSDHKDGFYEFGETAQATAEAGD